MSKMEPEASEALILTSRSGGCVWGGISDLWVQERKTVYHPQKPETSIYCAALSGRKRVKSQPPGKGDSP